MPIFTVYSLAKMISHSWYKRSAWLQCLRPLSWLYRAVISLRRGCYRLGLLKQTRVSVPVIVVGNITVGGTGKTPVVAAMVNVLKDKGKQVGIISRGYGGTGPFPASVTAHSDPAAVGDEPVLLARLTQAPIVVSPNRVAAANTLLNQHPLDLIVSDDGLQHYALARDSEYVLVNATQGFGNGLCLPAGPLREPMSRLASVDKIIQTQVDSPNLPSSVYYEFSELRSVNQSKPPIPIAKWPYSTVCALAGIAHPTLFFNTLNQLGWQVCDARARPDHAVLTPADLSTHDNLPLIMTEKDAVKCQHFAPDHCWYLPLKAKLSDDIIEQLNRL